MAKQAQVFTWEVKDRELRVIERKSGKCVFDATVDDYPDNVQSFLLDHGFKTKFQQFTSDDAVGDKVDRWIQLDSMFKDGILEEEGKGRGGLVVPDWIQVIADLKGCTVSDVQYSMKEWSKEARAEMKDKILTNYKDQVAAVAAQREAKVVDLSDI